jgi:iron complex outermembrane receptor protein
MALLNLSFTPPVKRWSHLIGVLSVILSSGALARAQIIDPNTEAAIAEQLRERPLELPPLRVGDLSDEDDEEFDATGMGSVEEELRSSPFSNELTTIDFEMEEGLSGDTSIELAEISSPSPAAVATGETRLNLRGFPTPVLRNSFIQMGILETLNIDRTIIIQGPLVPVLGRAAPGGIQNFLTTRPAARPRNVAIMSMSTDNRQRMRVESSGVVKPKKVWQRWAVDWNSRQGAEDFVDDKDLAVSGAVTVKHSRASSSMFSLDYRRYDGHPTSGVPEYKTAPGEKIIGPYRPLVNFNVNGPDGGVVRETFLLGAQFESQLSRAIAFRAAAEAWTRGIDQQRFTSSQYVLSTGLFEGTREPRHIAQRQQAVAGHVEMTSRFRVGKVEHKLLTFAGVTWGDYDRNDRALSVADRNALPLSVRRFDPFNPNYYSPEFDPALYSRVITDRTESARYASLEVSDRMAFSKGRTVATAGMRYDQVDLIVRDERATAIFPRTQDGTGQLSYHAGVNHQLVVNRALLFATVSTAFDPTTPVDVRTGRIQDNETTQGYEAGIKGRAKNGFIDYTVSGFLLYNRDISRRNPLYDDPIFDADQTQPQLVAAGEERFSGLRAELVYRFAKTMAVSVRGVRTNAVTTKSPSLGTEVGRQVARLPRDTATLHMRYSPAKGATGFKKMNLGVSLTYIGGYVAYYEDAKRHYLEYPGYALLNLGTGYGWTFGKRQLHVGANLRNALDRDLLVSHARPNSGREVSVTARLVF